MKTWLVCCGILCVLTSVQMFSLHSMPDWAQRVIDNYLGKYFRRRNEHKGFTDPELYMEVPELVRHRGYPIEIHEVVTEDGYYLTMHRINGRKNEGTFPKPVVFFQHGLGQTSMCFLLIPVNKALVYVLADRGYDVWLGNFRGSTYSRKHVKYTIKDNEYWDFTWDEYGQYDTPAMLQYVLNSTQQKDLTYVGHSLACATFFIFAELHPHLQSLVNSMIALGPAVIVANMRTPVRYTAPFVRQIEFMYKVLGTNEFLPNANLVPFVMQQLCTKTSEKPRKCENLLYLYTGSDPANFNVSLVPLINRYTPAGTSIRAVLQYAQGVKLKRFCRYDWGRAQNRRRYGQDTPPEYSVEKVTVPVEIFYGDNDWLAVPEDVAALAGRLKSLRGYHRVPFPDFNHMDFLFAVDIDTLLNNDVLKLIAHYNPSPQIALQKLVL